jgi:spoIIIJ-associated protein
VPDQNDKPLSDGALFVADEEDDLDDEDEPRGGAAKRSRGQPGDGKAEAAVEVLDGILARMDLDTEIGIREDGERIVLDVSGPDAGRAIGRKGQTLDALQFLVNKVVNRFPTGRRHVVVDSGDYRDRHDRGLVSLAKRQAKKAVQQGRVITLEPMSARDRRVIHLSLAKFPGVTTKSNGEGLGRRIQIIPARRRAGGRMDRDRDRGPMDRDRGPMDRDRGPMDRDRDRDRGPRSHERDD